MSKGNKKMRESVTKSGKREREKIKTTKERNKQKGERKNNGAEKD